MKTAAMIFAIVAFGAAMVNLWKFYHLKTEALRANGDRWPALKSWMWNAPLRVRDFRGHAADLAAGSVKAGFVFLVCFFAAVVALALANDDLDSAIFALLVAPFALGLCALCLLRSPNSKMEH